uniref:lytic polysaccharide monooxygenase n=1 Tax=Erwinia sp. V71 TaxID=3369424 RepID=UPI003F5D714F
MTLQRNNTLALILSVSGLTASSLAFSHGALVDPPARQVLCFQQGTLSGICKEASEKSHDRGQSIYTWQELTGFVGGAQRAEEAKKAIPDHLICSGTTKGSGFNLASASWKTTRLKPDAHGKVRMRYGYTQPHAPSWIEFYITKKDVDPTKKVIGWDDVELLASVASSVETVDISGMKPPYTAYDEYNIAIPADRTGRAVIFSRWQRAAPETEGFYGCSDVVISERGSNILPPPLHEHHQDDSTPVEWFEYSKFAATQRVQAGDNVIFRLMGEASGSDLVNIRKAITASNADGQWITELAAEINKNHSGLVQIGQKSSSGLIEFNPQQLRNNRIFFNHKGYSAVLTVSTLPVIVNEKEPHSVDYPLWQSADSSSKCNAKPPVLTLQRPLKAAGTR